MWRTNLLSDMIQSCLVVYVRTAKQVHGCVSVLGPGVNCKVRFRNDDNAADSLGTELVKKRHNHLRAAEAGGLNQNPLNEGDIVYLQPVAVEKFSQIVLPQRH